MANEPLAYLLTRPGIHGAVWATAAPIPESGRAVLEADGVVIEPLGRIAQIANERLSGQIYDLLIDGMAAPEDHDDVRAAFARIGVMGEDFHRLMVANQKQREDVARYHWLRDEHIGDDPESINLTAARREGLDAAIDAARPHGKRYDD